MSSPKVSLECTLDPADVERLATLLASAPRSATVATWLEGRGLVWIGAKLEGELVGWFITPATDQVEAQTLGRALAELLADGVAPFRAASEAARELIRRSSH